MLYLVVVVIFLLILCPVCFIRCHKNAGGKKVLSRHIYLHIDASLNISEPFCHVCSFSKSFLFHLSQIFIAMFRFCAVIVVCLRRLSLIQVILR